MSDDIHFASQTEADIYFLEAQMAAIPTEGPRRNTRHHASNGYPARKLARLERARYALQHCPIYKLSDEVLSYIFKMCAITPTGLDIAASLKISRVVSRWRRVALNTPALWTELHFCLPLTKSKSNKIKAFSDRAASSPLDIRVRLRVSSGQALDLGLDDKTINYPGLLQRARSLHCLPIVEVIGDREYFVILPNFATTPLLPLAFLNLRRANFRRLTDFLGLLRLCTRLQQLQLTEVRIWHDRSPTSNAIELPILAHLHLSHVMLHGDPRRRNVLTLLDCITTPKLEHFELYQFNDMTEPCRSPCLSNVSSFVVSSVRSVRPAILVPTICGMPALKHLEIHLFLHEDTSELPARLAIPLLETLSFVGSSGVGVGPLALWLAEQTTGDGVSTGSLQIVTAPSANGIDWNDVSRAVLQSIRERVPEVKFTKRRVRLATAAGKKR